jgi:two-component system, NarL family, nitrate/nitrite response regulator NarL
MAADPIRVLVADAQPLFLESVARTFRQDAGFHVVAEASDGRTALERIRAVAPAVAVLDHDLPGLDGGRVLDAVVRDELPARILLMSADVRPGVAFAAVAAGARGYLSKCVPGETVRSAVRRIAAGGAALCDDLQTVVADEIRLRYRDERSLLSARERQIVALMAEGLTTRQIGLRLHLSISTVKSYTENLYERLGVRERAQAVAEAMRRGLLE